MNSLSINKSIDEITKSYPSLKPWQRLIAKTPEKKDGNIKRLLAAWQMLPNINTDHFEIIDGIVTIGKEDEINTKQKSELKSALMALRPWRKGPYNLFGQLIDSEWCSDLKWDRLEKNIEPLNNKLVLDVGCGNGYHCWRMLSNKAKCVIGIDPSSLFHFQYAALKKYRPNERVYFLKQTLEDLPCQLEAFDTVFSMGVIYHRKSPLEHLEKLKSCLKSGGQCILETLTIDGNANTVLVPEDRYASMANVFFIASIDMLKIWLQKSGWQDIEIIDVSTTTIKEQRSTCWSSPFSLANSLNKGDVNKTIEGYPAPKRVILKAIKP